MTKKKRQTARDTRLHVAKTLGLAPTTSAPALAAAVRQFLTAPESPPSTVGPARAPLKVFCPRGGDEALAIAQMVTRGLGHNAGLIDDYTRPLSGATDLNACVTALEHTIATVQQGDLGPAESLLVAQATSLNAIYVRCASIANLNLQHVDAMERFLRLALRAQGQCRATLETLAVLRNPTTVFARQANIAHGPQQVNNTQVNTPVDAETQNGVSTDRGDASPLSGTASEEVPQTRRLEASRARGKKSGPNELLS